MVQIHFHLKIPSSSNIQGLMQTSSYKILQLQNITMYWIQVFWSFCFRLHKNLHQQERVPDKKNIAIISAPFLWRHLFRYWHPKSRFLSNLTFFTHYLKWTHNLSVGTHYKRLPPITWICWTFALFNLRIARCPERGVIRFPATVHLSLDTVYWKYRFSLSHDDSTYFGYLRSIITIAISTNDKNWIDTTDNSIMSDAKIKIHDESLSIII